jgi:hypothetical protein
VFYGIAHPEHSVAYGPTAKQWLCKQRPLLGNAHNIHTCNNRMTGLWNLFLSNGSVNMFPWQHTSATIEERRFLCGSCQNIISRVSHILELELSTVQLSEVMWSSWLVSERVQLSVGSQPVKRRLGRWCEMATSLGLPSWVVSWQEFCMGSCDKRTWVWEAEESSLVEAVARKQLVETVIDWGH